jgi:magnesium chelatase subunit D
VSAVSAVGERPEFPFAGVVGLDEVKLALVLAAVDRRIGGVLLRGQKGSAKTTLARGVAALLPGAAPFVELPIGASEDRVVGTIDLAAALRSGERVFRAGLLAAADGGVLYVDEVNLLPDHLVDVLLDVAVSGVNRVEREGVSHTHGSRFVLIGSMNPEEGELRPQLLDRFGLAVDVAASSDPSLRAEAVRRRIAFDADPVGFAGRWAGESASLRARVAALEPAHVGDDLLIAVSEMCALVGAEGLRADLVICRAAAALAGWEGRGETSIEDVRRVAPLALGHRRRRGPFEAPGIDPAEVDAALGEATGRAEKGDAGGSGAPGDPPGPQEPPGPPGGGAGPRTGPDAREDGARRHEGERRQPAPETPPPPAPAIAPPALLAPARRSAKEPGSGPVADGRRDLATGGRGRLVRDRPVGGDGLLAGPVALSATVVAAGERRRLGAGGATVAELSESEPLIEEGDLREAVLERRAASLVVLVVDASGSMGAARRMEVAKGAVLGLLLDAYQRRDRVAVVTFAGDKACVALRPTGSVEVARSRLDTLSTGGRTPLAEGILTGLELCLSQRDGAYRPLLVLVSDGRATFAADGRDPVAASRDAAELVRRRAVPAVVLDAEEGAIPLGLAQPLADAMGGRCISLDSLTVEAVDAAVRGALPAR